LANETFGPEDLVLVCDLCQPSWFDEIAVVFSQKLHVGAYAFPLVSAQLDDRDGVVHGIYGGYHTDLAIPCGWP
jgi:hypothetical protein